MRFTISAALLAFLVLFNSCATIVSGSRQWISFDSEPVSATVFINEVEIGKTPVQKKLKRNQEYQILIKLDGYEPYETILTKKFNAWYLGNILIGGLVGLIVDASTGAIFKLTPDEINARMSNATVFNTVGDKLYVTVGLSVDRSLEKVGQLKKAN